MITTRSPLHHTHNAYAWSTLWPFVVMVQLLVTLPFWFSWGKDNWKRQMERDQEARRKVAQEEIHRKLRAREAEYKREKRCHICGVGPKKEYHSDGNISLYTDTRHIHRCCKCSKNVCKQCSKRFWEPASVMDGDVAFDTCRRCLGY